MAGRLPNLPSGKVIKALERAGFLRERQKGSHVTLRHPVTRYTTVVPVHSGDLHRSLLKLIISQAGLSEEAFRKLL